MREANQFEDAKTHRGCKESFKEEKMLAWTQMDANKMRKHNGTQKNAKILSKNSQATGEGHITILDQLVGVEI